MEGAGILGTMVGQVGSTLLALALMFGGPVLYLWLQIRALAGWTGWWRIGAVVPLLFMAAATSVMVAGLRDGANLAPLAVIFGLPVALAWLLVFAWIRGAVVRT